MKIERKYARGMVRKQNRSSFIMFRRKAKECKTNTIIHVLGIFYAEVETHVIEKKERKIIVCGQLRPSDVAVKLQKKMKRRVEILEIEDLTGGHGREGEEGHDHEPMYQSQHEYPLQPDHMATPLLC